MTSWLRSKPYLPVLASACALVILSFGFRAGFGLFMLPLSETRGWGRDVLATALALQNLSWGLCALVAGALADRIGNLKVLLAGVGCYALGMVTMSLAATELQLMLTAGLLVGAGVAGTSFGIVLPSLARAVPPEQRGWALGIGTAAGSFGQFLIVPIMQAVVNAVGWMPALQILGVAALAMAVFCLPLAPYGGAPNTHRPNEPPAPGNAAAATPAPTPPLWQIARRAFRLRSYTLLTLGFFVCGFHVAFITVHMPGYVVDLGFAPEVGAWSISLIGFCNIFGAFYAGVLSGKVPMRTLLTVIYLGRVVAISLFLTLPVTLPGILLFSAAMGFLWLATVPPTSGLVAVFFGTRYMAFLYGIVFLSHQLGSFSGVWLGGWLYERYGNYDGIWIAGIVLGLAAAALHWPIEEKGVGVDGPDTGVGLTSA